MSYEEIPVREQVEVVSLVGDIALRDGEPALHAHVVLARRDGSTVGGHLRRAIAWPTLEVVVTETPAHLHKRVGARDLLRHQFGNQREVRTVRGVHATAGQHEQREARPEVPGAEQI